MSDEQLMPQGSGRNNGFLRNFSGYLRIVSNGASTVASTVRQAGASVASSIAERDDDAGRDQVPGPVLYLLGEESLTKKKRSVEVREVLWAGFDKLEYKEGELRQVLLLGYRSGFQVWDIEDGDDVRQLVSRHDGPVSILQMQKRPVVTSKIQTDKFKDVRPLLVVAGDFSMSGGSNNFDGGPSPCNGSIGHCQDMDNENRLPTYVHFYSLRTHDYVHVLKFRTGVYSVRCSHRIVAVSQAAQIHCFDAGTLEKDYTILTCPIVSGYPGSGGLGYGPLAVGPRWLAYSGNPVLVSTTSRVSPQRLTSAMSLSRSSSNGSVVAQYAKESSKQLAAGIVTLGDIGYKKLTRYYLERITDSNGSVRHGSSSFKANGTVNGHATDVENAGMVIVRDIVLKSVIVQFRAHRSPIAALCFDPTGTLLVTASTSGHNINVFHIMPSPYGSSDSDATGTCTHLYRLQRGITNAVIQDINFSDDGQWIMISSSRGTSHLFAIPPSNLQVSDVSLTTDGYRSETGSLSLDRSRLDSQTHYSSNNPITLSVVARIRHGNGWKETVSSAAAAATGRISPLSGAVASVFHNCRDDRLYTDMSSLKTKHYLLVFSPTGSVVQYVLRQPTGEDSGIDISGLTALYTGLSQDSESRVVVEALQKWDICHWSRRDGSDCVDVYSEYGNGEYSKIFQKGVKKATGIYPTNNGAATTVKHSAEATELMYISEVELQMHPVQVPLWAKSKMYFQVIMDANIPSEINNSMGGEIEIEKIPSRTIEARSKELIPVIDYLQSHRFQQPRANHFDFNRNGLAMGRKYGVAEVGRLSRRSSCNSLDLMSDSSGSTEHPNNINENSWNTFHTSAETNKGFVNNSKGSQYVNNQLEFVNNREGLKMEAQLESVNNKESLNITNHFVDHDNDVD